MQDGFGRWGFGMAGESSEMSTRNAISFLAATARSPRSNAQLHSHHTKQQPFHRLLCSAEIAHHAHRPGIYSHPNVSLAIRAFRLNLSHTSARILSSSSTRSEPRRSTHSGAASRSSIARREISTRVPSRSPSCVHPLVSEIAPKISEMMSRTLPSPPYPWERPFARGRASRAGWRGIRCAGRRRRGRCRASGCA